MYMKLDSLGFCFRRDSYWYLDGLYEDKGLVWSLKLVVSSSLRQSSYRERGGEREENRKRNHRNQNIGSQFYTITRVYKYHQASYGLGFLETLRLGLLNRLL
jgi:hypothetical protein